MHTKCTTALFRHMDTICWSLSTGLLYLGAVHDHVQSFLQLSEDTLGQDDFLYAGRKSIIQAFCRLGPGTDL